MDVVPKLEYLASNPEQLVAGRVHILNGWREKERNLITAQVRNKPFVRLRFLLILR